MFIFTELISAMCPLLWTIWHTEMLFTSWFLLLSFCWHDSLVRLCTWAFSASPQVETAYLHFGSFWIPSQNVTTVLCCLQCWNLWRWFFYCSLGGRSRLVIWQQPCSCDPKLPILLFIFIIMCIIIVSRSPAPSPKTWWQQIQLKAALWKLHILKFDRTKFVCKLTYRLSKLTGIKIYFKLKWAGSDLALQVLDGIRKPEETWWFICAQTF